MMNKIILVIVVILTSATTFSQFDIKHDWEHSVDDQGKVGIYHGLIDDDYTATFSFKYYDIVYSKKLNVKAQEWGYVNLKTDFGFKTSSLKENPGLLKINLIVNVQGHEVVKEEVFYAPYEDKVLHETDLSSIEDHLHLYGNTIVDSYFWSDKGGYNYVIRSKNGDQAGLFLAYWKVNHKGDAEQVDFYKNTLDCGPKLNRMQQHSEEVALNDANEDGTYEFYSMVLDGCIQEETESKGARLFVFTSNQKSLQLEGGTYATSSKHDNKGGQYEISENLKKLNKIQEKAKDVWEIFVLNF
jgi:hypothetical protein